MEIILFIVGSLWIMYLSRKSVVDPCSHGFYRFFAWEILLAMLLIVYPFWFQNPFAPAQILSWILLVIAAILPVYGAILLRRHGLPDPERQEESLIAFEKTTRLVTDGVYRYIRHPLYCSLLLLGWGMFLKHPALLPAGMAAAVSLLLFRTAAIDEAECRKYFGTAYAEYCARTKRFIPFVY